MPEIRLKTPDLTGYDEFVIDRLACDNYDIRFVILVTAKKEKIRDRFKLATDKVWAWLMVPGFFTQNSNRFIP